MKNPIILLLVMLIPVAALGSLKKKSLWGKTINVIGDSYVYNHKQPQNLTWHYQLGAKYKMTYRQFGKNGNGLVTPQGSGVPVINRYNEMPDDADYVVLIGGKNDYNKQISIADFMAGLHTICKGIMNKYPGKKICFFTPWKVFANDSDDTKDIKLSEYANAIKEVCAVYGIPVYDANNDDTIRMYDSAFRAKYCQGGNDVSHLNEAGHKLFLKKAEKFLLKL